MIRNIIYNITMIPTLTRWLKARTYEIRDYGKNKKLDLEHQIEEQRQYFENTSFPDRRKVYMAEYHKLQSQHLRKYGRYHKVDGKPLGLVTMADYFEDKKNGRHQVRRT